MARAKVFRAIQELCTRCRMCELTCSLAKTGTVTPSRARIRVHQSGEHGACGVIFCRHCKAPLCQKACPVPEAMSVDQGTGAVSINQAICIGCRACVEACPFDAIQIGPEGEVLKCDLCGGNPVCVKYCPPRPAAQFPSLPYPEASCLEYIEPHKATRKIPESDKPIVKAAHRAGS